LQVLDLRADAIAKAELWNKDPLHAKIGLLKEMANISKGLGVQPRWSRKASLVAKTERLAARVAEKGAEGIGILDEEEREEDEGVGEGSEWADGSFRSRNFGESEGGNLGLLGTIHSDPGEEDEEDGIDGGGGGQISMSRKEIVSQAMTSQSEAAGGDEGPAAVAAGDSDDADADGQATREGVGKSEGGEQGGSTEDDEREKEGGEDGGERGGGAMGGGNAWKNPIDSQHEWSRGLLDALGGPEYEEEEPEEEDEDSDWGES
jgi:hypothetical protein